MPGYVTTEQIQDAKTWDLLSYLQKYEPHELIKSASNEYRTTSHDSLVISNGLWSWKSQNIGGRSALDYLIKVREISFVDAVQILCSEKMVSTPPAGKKIQIYPERTEPLRLPEISKYPNHVLSYLQERGIDPEIIHMCIQKGIIQESRKHQNCVFIGKDPQGMTRYAAVRSVQGDYRLDLPGSNKDYCFCFSPDDDARKVVAAESAIDALSVATIRKIWNQDWKNDHYQSLGGTSSKALIQFLLDHPKVDVVAICLDNDSAGLSGVGRTIFDIQNHDILKTRHFEYEIEFPDPQYGKDYNNQVTAMKEEREKVTRRIER